MKIALTAVVALVLLFIGLNFLKGINVFNERWCGTGKCVTVTSPLDKKSYVFSEYTSDGVKFIAGKDSYGYWLFFAA